MALVWSSVGAFAAASVVGFGVGYLFAWELATWHAVHRQRLGRCFLYGTALLWARPLTTTWASQTYLVNHWNNDRRATRLVVKDVRHFVFDLFLQYFNVVLPAQTLGHLLAEVLADEALSSSESRR